MTHRAATFLTVLAAAALAALPAFAAPVLKQTVTVDSALVTAGDLFSDAGINAEKALFRSPAPGTAGEVGISAIRAAAGKAGIATFTNPGFVQVRVERAGIPVTTDMLKSLIGNDLRRRGILSGDMVADIAFDKSITLPEAAPADEPVSLGKLRYTPGSGYFTAEFSLNGVKQPLEMHGRLNVMIEAPHIVASMPSGAILSPDDIEMRPVDIRFAQNGLATMQDLVGKALRRSSREGMLLRASDVEMPEIVKRSQMVTLTFRVGPMNLTMKGQALNAAAKGEAVAVLNLSSKKIVHGTAVDFGTVEMQANAVTQVADNSRN